MKKQKANKQDNYKVDAKKKEDGNGTEISPKELEARYKRALADYQNLSRRYEAEKEDMKKLANEVLLTKLVEVLDDFEETLKHVKNDGIKNVYKKLVKIVTDSGLEVVDPVDQDFDPGLHEVVEVSNGEKNKITKVYRKGYVLNGKVIRPAAVEVGNNEESN